MLVRWMRMTLSFPLDNIFCFLALSNFFSKKGMKYRTYKHTIWRPKGTKVRLHLNGSIFVRRRFHNSDPRGINEEENKDARNCNCKDCRIKFFGVETIKINVEKTYVIR